MKKGADPLDERTPIPINVEFTNEKLSFSMTIDEENCWTVYLNESETCIFLKLIDSAIPLMSGFNLISPSIPNSTNVDFMNFP